MDWIMWGGILLPFIGTSFGAAGVYFLKKSAERKRGEILAGFSSGIMAAASVWSLLLPAIERSGHYGAWAFFPAAVGYWSGVLFLVLLEDLLPKKEKAEKSLLTLAMVLHNIPEGMAVGVVYAAWKAGNAGVTLAGATSLALGIAIQNIPEGAVISMPLLASGKGKGESFRAGVLSGAVEPLSAALTLMAAGIIVPLMPYFLSFAAGAMFTVVVKELIPEAGEKGIIWFSVGFTLMMALDVALG